MRKVRARFHGGHGTDSDFERGIDFFYFFKWTRQGGACQVKGLACAKTGVKQYVQSYGP